MMEHNKNLSSIVGTIQDEVPSRPSPDGATASFPDDTEISDSFREGRRPSALRLYLYLVLASLTLGAAFLFLAGRDGEEPLAEAIEPARTAGDAVPSIPGIQEGNYSNREIHERQAMIMKQLDGLSAAMAENRASNDRYRVDNMEILERMQDDFQEKLDIVAASVAGLKSSSVVHKESMEEKAASPEKESSDVTAKQTTSSAVPASGGWVVNVASAKHLKPVEQLMDKLRKHDIQAEIQEVVIAGKTRYRLRIPGFGSRAEARDYAQNLDGGLGLKDPWVGTF